MQPYIFPYLGYYQLINAVDKFVIYDDVNYIKRGWINRNNILVGNSIFLFTIPVQEASQNKLINEIRLGQDRGWREKLLKTIEQGYKKAPFFSEIFVLLNQIIFTQVSYISQLAFESLVQIAGYLSIGTEFVPSSSIYDNRQIKAQERILDICAREGATQYINPIGGLEFYSRHLFDELGVKINFLKTMPVAYKQFGRDFVPLLSIIDILMFNSKEEVIKMLSSYELL
ncbi:MAG TPA: WbqC family protein [Aquella sp.]|nr:WbqC family protein [Aquella sp.]